MSGNRPLVIYHARCPDGFTAAWIAARALRDVELFPGEYGKEPPYDLARGRPVWIVDFSYPRAQLEQLYRAAGEGDWAEPIGSSPLWVLDHHKTAQAALEDLPYCTFDMNRSGAGITWDHFHPGEPRPWIVDYVEDRDLWRFRLEHSEAVSLLVLATPHTLEAWDDLATRERTAVLAEAAGCKRYLDHYVADALRQAYLTELRYSAPPIRSIRSEPCVAVNVSYTGVSDVLNAALAANPGIRVALGWHLAADGMLNCSLRSTSGFDCSSIAKWYGGGGHAQASGFRMALDHEYAAHLLAPKPLPDAERP